MCTVSEINDNECSARVEDYNRSAFVVRTDGPSSGGCLKKKHGEEEKYNACVNETVKGSIFTSMDRSGKTFAAVETQKWGRNEVSSGAG